MKHGINLSYNDGSHTNESRPPSVDLYPDIVFLALLTVLHYCHFQIVVATWRHTYTPCSWFDAFAMKIIYTGGYIRGDIRLCH